jgi:hypothetical protein
MGYTHYWEYDATKCPEKYLAARQDCLAIMEQAIDDGIALKGWNGRDPIVPGVVSFNGDASADEHYETFRLPDTHLYCKFDFCKTGRCLYDEVVTACLIALQDRLGKRCSVRSDGSATHWEDGLDLAQRALGRDLEIPADVRCKDDE